MVWHSHLFLCNKNETKSQKGGKIKLHGHPKPFVKSAILTITKQLVNKLQMPLQDCTTVSLLDLLMMSSGVMYYTVSSVLCSSPNTYPMPETLLGTEDTAVN